MKTNCTTHHFYAAIFLAFATSALGDITFNTSFEKDEGYNNGPINGQQGWTVEGLSDFSFVNVVSNLAAQGGQSLLFDNQYLLTTVNFTLRRSIPLITLNSNRVAASLHWTPISGQLSCKAGWKLVGPYVSPWNDAPGYGTAAYIDGAFGGTIFIGQNGAEIGLYPFWGDGVIADYVRWTHLSSVASFGRQYPTGEIVSQYSNSIANTSGSFAITNGAWLADFPNPVEWLDITVQVDPLSSVALDIVDFTMQSYDIPISNTPPQTLAVEISPAIKISWPSRIGFEYQLQWTDQLVSNTWYNLGSNTAGSDATSAVLVPFSASSPEYFRVREWPKP